MNPTTSSRAESIREALRSIDDPELDCNIVDLGLIYDVGVSDSVATVTMTMTSPGCPLHQSIIDAVHTVVLSLPGLDEVRVDLVWDPPWSPGLMSESARTRLGVPG